MSWTHNLKAAKCLRIRTSSNAFLIDGKTQIQCYYEGNCRVRQHYCHLGIGYWKSPGPAYLSAEPEENDWSREASQDHTTSGNLGITAQNNTECL